MAVQGTRIPRILLETQRFSVEAVPQPRADGAHEHRAIVRHPGAVVVLPVVDTERICLIRNFRASVDAELIELPAGTLEPGEDPEVAAHRELAEETGYRAERIERLRAFYPSPGILDEKMVLFLATGLTPGPPRREPGEQIQNLIVSWKQALEMVDSGSIQDAKTLIGLLLVDRMRQA
jgi:ADP-ribose pyrophosphatase